MKRYLTLLAAAAILTMPASAHALEFGVQDDWGMRNHPATVLDAGHDLGATWVRTILSVGDKDGPARIRAAHAEGFKVLVTIGGTGTGTRKPSQRSILKYLRRLPMADRYTVINEPDLSGVKPCVYRRTWMAARRILGRRLLFGDFSPIRPLTYTAAIVRNCGDLPKHLEFALHPYQKTDPLKAGADEGSIGNLRYARQWLKTNVGVTVDWWLTEFGYLYGGRSAAVDAVSDTQAASMWPRAKVAATRAHAKMLGVYMAQGPSWDSKPRELAWLALTGQVPAPAFEATDEPPVPFDPGYY